MSYQPDTFKASLLWGRVGAFVLGLLAFVLGLFGYTMSPEDVAAGEVLITGLLAGVAGVLALVSKVRESKKAK